MIIKAIVYKQDQGYVAYLPGDNENLYGSGDDPEEALEDLRKAILHNVTTEGGKIDTSVREISISDIDIDI
jgi:predicted RNase H-like HicB family nuclease